MWITPVHRVDLALCPGAIVGVARMQTDLLYYRRRFADERAAAAAAADAKVASVHLELARRYGERIGALESVRRESPLHLVSAA